MSTADRTAQSSALSAALRHTIDTATTNPETNPETTASATIAPSPPPDIQRPTKTKLKDGVNRRRRRERRSRRQSFAAESYPLSLASMPQPERERQRQRSPSPRAEGTTVERNASLERRREEFYRLRGHGSNLSDTSLESEALLDHRNHASPLARRQSRLSRSQSVRPDSFVSPSGQQMSRSYAPDITTTASRPSLSHSRTTSTAAAIHPRSYSRSMREDEKAEDESDGGADDRTPLIRPRRQSGAPTGAPGQYGTTTSRDSPPQLLRLPHPAQASPSSVRSRGNPPPPSPPQFNVNNPPSMPGSPRASVPSDVAVGSLKRPSPDQISDEDDLPYDAVIEIDASHETAADGSEPDGAQRPASKRPSVSLHAQEDVCFPTEGLSDLAEDDFARPMLESTTPERRHRRRRVWPDLAALDDWSRVEKEEQHGSMRAKKIDEPMLIGGRLRPRNAIWRREEADAPYRFTYFNEELESTIHSQTISGLLQPGQSYRELFVPDPPVLDDSSGSSGEDDGDADDGPPPPRANGAPALDDTTPASTHVRTMREQELRHGPRPTFWLDVACPTDAEMKVLAKAFGIHALTAEDIMMQEAREKVELFRHYYFINYRTFEQDVNSENYLEPVNVYAIVFRDGLLTFHFSMIPHPANVRRRIRQLKDYLILSADWISYALIDDITDAFGPMIHAIESEVDAIDDVILRMYSDDREISPTGSMLRRVGECRKKVMGLYRLLGNKADVIKGFAKRCNEQWEVAPKSEIGLYLGDIQDHIVTMTSNLAHYESLLSRAHSNYLAQINIDMNERQEKTADVLGKLTVLGTIVLPMNIITGMWGMNVKVPGQDIDSLTWFMSITFCLLLFGVLSFYVAKRVYGIV